ALLDGAWPRSACGSQGCHGLCQRRRGVATVGFSFPSQKENSTPLQPGAVFFLPGLTNRRLVCGRFVPGLCFFPRPLREKTFPERIRVSAVLPRVLAGQA